MRRYELRNPRCWCGVSRLAALCFHKGQAPRGALTGLSVDGNVQHLDGSLQQEHKCYSNAKLRGCGSADASPCLGSAHDRCAAHATSTATQGQLCSQATGIVPSPPGTHCMSPIMQTLSWSDRCVLTWWWRRLHVPSADLRHRPQHDHCADLGTIEDRKRRGHCHPCCGLATWMQPICYMMEFTILHPHPCDWTSWEAFHLICRARAPARVPRSRCSGRIRDAMT